MAFKYPAASFFESVGSSTADFSELVRDQVAGHACDIWELYPAWITEGDNLGTSFARGFMNRVCAKDGRTPPPYSPPPFVGGQCCDIVYSVRVDYSFLVSGGGRDTSFTTFNLTGAINSITIVPGLPPDDDRAFLFGSTTACDGTTTDDFITSIGSFQADFQIESIIVSRVDGLPDNCGNPPGGYPDVPPPQPSDLNTTVIINDIDNSDIEIPIIWNNISNDFRFPMNFSVGGMDVTIDFSGMTFHGNRNINDPSGVNVLPDTPKKIRDSDGVEVEIEDDNGDIMLPEFPVIPPVDVDLEWLVCESGIISIVAGTVKALPGSSDLVKLIVDLVVSIIEEVCKVDSDVGLPEIYPVLPGVERPVIMYYYKQVINGIKQPSTFVSTLPNPTAAAVNEIETFDYPDRGLGNFVYSLRLLDGSRIVARGTTAADALTHYTFLLNRVRPDLVPPNQISVRVLTEYSTMDSLTVKCTQVEYYPDGKDFARNPSVLRVIDVSED